jgi:DNA-binding GntR family transcriptional regulator
MALDVSDPRSPAEQVAHRLRQAIAHGRYKPGDKLPTGQELAAEYSVARGTVMRALDILRAEKLVQSWQGKGTFVRQATPSEDGDLGGQVSRLGERIEAGEGRTDELGHRVDEQQHLLAGIKREVQDHARLLARMRRRLEEAGITLADPEQRDERAI